MNLNAAFPTPIYENELVDKRIEKEFQIVIDDLKQTDAFKLNRATECQYLSDPTFLENLFDSYDLSVFKSYLEENIRNYVKMVVPTYVTNRKYDFNIETSWLTLNKKGHYSHLHHHADADISGVYYVKTNGNDGELIFENPNRLITTSYLLNTWQESMHYVPQEGKLILFPGWLIHRVNKNETDNERISFSFNVMFKRGQ
jgi:uncharacterized protein (TIGR02466 family)